MNNKDKMKELLEALDPTDPTYEGESLDWFLRKARYPREVPGHYPNSDKGEEKAHKLEELIASQYERYKDDSSFSEYQYYYDIDGTQVVFNYRFGGTGRIAWWIQ